MHGQTPISIPNSCGLQNGKGLIEKEFLKIVAGPVPIDNEEIADLVHGHQGMMPDIAAIVHPLVATGENTCGRPGRPASSADTATRNGRPDSGEKLWLPSGWRSIRVI